VLYGAIRLETFLTLNFFQQLNSNGSRGKLSEITGGRETGTHAGTSSCLDPGLRRDDGGGEQVKHVAQLTH
jgi:hypothetical protein